jgi:hypothetical protein
VQVLTSDAAFSKGLPPNAAYNSSLRRQWA